MQNQAGARKARDKILSTRPNFYHEVGSLGGKVKVKTKGFGSDPERARLAGMKGGKNSRKMTDAKLLEIKHLRSSGFSLKAIADKTGFSYVTIQKYCRPVHNSEN